MHDLICADYEEYKGVFEKAFPLAIIKDVSNDNFKKFSVDMDDNCERKYYKFLIKSGISQFSCDFLIRLRKKEGRKFLDDLTREIKKEPPII